MSVVPSIFSVEGRRRQCACDGSRQAIDFAFFFTLAFFFVAVAAALVFLTPAFDPGFGVAFAAVFLTFGFAFLVAADAATTALGIPSVSPRKFKALTPSGIPRPARGSVMPA